MIPFLTIAPVLIPLLLAPLIVLIGAGRLVWILSLMGAMAATLSAFLLLDAVAIGPQHYHFGNWPPPFGIEYILDGLNTPLLLLTSGAATLALLAAPPGTLSAHLQPRSHTFYALFLLCLAGLNGILSTGDAFNVFVFLEISSLATYALVASGRGRGAALGAFQYLILGTLGGSLVLLGIGLWLQATGSLNLADIAQRMDTTAYPGLVLGGGVLLLLGFALKSASFPFQQWLPAVYAAAPWQVTAFLAACATKVAVYALVRMVLVIGELPALGLSLIGGVALIGILWGAVAATAQTNVRRLLAWSSVSQLGYLMFAFSLGTRAGVVAAMLQFYAHATIKGGLFLSLGEVRDLRDLSGLRQSDPWRCAAITLLTLGLIGVPLSAGFLAKWSVLTAAWDAQHLWGLGVVVLSSLIAVIYALRILEPIWLQPAGQPVQAALRGFPALPSLIAVGLMFWLGTHRWVADWGGRAAQSMGWGP